MVVTITPAGANSLVGPGQIIQVASSWPGPIVQPGIWVVTLAHAATPAVAVNTFSWPTSSLTDTHVALSDTTEGTGFYAGQGLQQEDPVHLTADLYSNGTLEDTGTFSPATWDTTGQAWAALLLAKETKAAGGLTAGQAAQLDDIQTTTTVISQQQEQQVTDSANLLHVLEPLTSTAMKTIDALDVVEITSGPTGDFVGHNLTAFIFGVIIRLASVPDWAIPRTPDGDYFDPTLCVVRIFHGDDLWLRRPIHTTSAIVQWDRGIYQVAWQALETFLWPSAMTLQVTFLEGVTGQVFLMLTP